MHNVAPESFRIPGQKNMHNSFSYFDAYNARPRYGFLPSGVLQFLFWMIPKTLFKQKNVSDHPALVEHSGIEPLTSTLPV